MTKISKKSAYPIKNPVVEDYFVGTDSENFNKTVNFGFQQAANLVNSINGTLISNYKFITNVNVPADVVEEGSFSSQNSVTTIGSLTKLYISKKNFLATDLTELFQFISVNRELFLMRLRNSNNLKNSVYFNITGVIEFSDYFEFNITIYLNNGAFPNLINFNIYFFDFELASSDLAINLPEFNKIISSTGFTVLSNNVTVNASWIWIIKNVHYTNSNAVVINIPLASAGMKRIDLIALTTFNTIIRVAGSESSGNPVKPNLPVDTLEATFCLVNDAQIEEIPPPDLSAYATINYVDGKDLLLSNRISALEKAPYTPFKFVQKGFGNTDLTQNQIGDIFCGWNNAGTIRYSEAKWLGGSLTDSNNFTPLVQTEI